MPKHYIYRIDHDEGFAPNVDFGICTLCGCKKTTVEKWAQEGSWVVGVGGNNTGKPHKLICAMEVEKVLPFSEFRARYIRKSVYLRAKRIAPEANVLISRKFYYFGDKAIDFPNDLQHIIIRGRGCQRVSDRDIATLNKYLKSRYAYGKLGSANNPKKQRARC